MSKHKKTYAAYGAVELSSGEEIDLDGSQERFSRLQRRIAKGGKIKTLDPGAFLGKEANTVVEVFFSVSFTSAKELEKFIKSTLK